ncbi:MAG: type II toxin-antitoxin system MqsR family toxin [Pseudomonas sp.]
MATISLEAKKAYAAKTRKSNYAASLRLEGFKTTHADHTIWQDVYRPSTQAGDVYLKLTIIDDVLIVFFKEL